MDKLLLEKIKLQIDFLYWHCGCNHDERSADAYGNLFADVNQLEGLIKDLITILGISGINSKEIARKKLEEIIK